MNTIEDFVKSSSLTLYETPMRQEALKDYWNRQGLFGADGKADHYKIQGYYLYGLSFPTQRETAADILSQEMDESGAWSLTSVELAMGVDFDYRALEKLRQPGIDGVKSYMAKVGASVGESFGQAKCVLASNVLTGLFSSASYVAHDGQAICDTHTLDDGSTVDNDLPAGALTKDLYWDMIYYLRWSQRTQKGLYQKGTPWKFVCNPVNEELLWQIQKQKYVPGESSSINDENFISKNSDYQPTVVFNPDLGANERFMFGEKAQKNLVFKVEKKLTTKHVEHERNRTGSKLTHAIFLVGYKGDYIDVVGAPAA